MAVITGRAAATSATQHAAHSRQAVRRALRAGQVSRKDKQPPASSSPSAQNLPTSLARRPSTSSTSSGGSLEAPERYLLRFGYVQGGPSALQLQVRIQGHVEEDGHTLYLLSGTFRSSAEDASDKFASTAWSCQHRLCDLRDLLHDPVKEALGQEAYEATFGVTPFARHGGVPGTSARLAAWLSSLASCMNGGLLEPQAAMHALRFLEAPDLEDGEARVQRAEQAALQKAGRCMVCTVAIGRHEQDGLCVRCQLLHADARQHLATITPVPGEEVIAHSLNPFDDEASETQVTAMPIFQGPESEN